jgi:hypothetical protein
LFSIGIGRNGSKSKRRGTFFVFWWRRPTNGRRPKNLRFFRPQYLAIGWAVVDLLEQNSLDQPIPEVIPETLPESLPEEVPQNESQQ